MIPWLIALAGLPEIQDSVLAPTWLTAIYNCAPMGSDALFLCTDIYATNHQYT